MLCTSLGKTTCEVGEMDLHEARIITDSWEEYLPANIAVAVGLGLKLGGRRPRVQTGAAARETAAQRMARVRELMVRGKVASA